MASNITTLVEKAKLGDADAFSTLYQMYYPKMKGICINILREDKAVVDDLVQDAFILAFVSLKDLKNTHRFSQWLTSITTNLVLKYQEKGKKYNFISLSEIEEDFSIQDKEKRFKSLENQKYLLYVGHRTESYKNFNVAVKAASLVKEKYKLVIVGEALSDEEKKFVEKEIGNRYLIISKLKNKELNYLYNKAFALLYPSLYEGFGIPIVEAMKTKCPVIAVNSSSIPEVAGNGAILIDNINPLAIFESLKRLENSEFRNQLTERGLKQSEKFNWDNTFNLYIDYYTYLYNKK